MKKIFYSIFTVLMFAVVNVSVKASTVFVCPSQVSLITVSFNNSCTRNSVGSTNFDLTSYYDSYMASHRGQQLASWGLSSNIGNFLNLVSVNGNTLSLSTSLLYNILPIEVYANWEEASVYEITLNSNGGNQDLPAIYEKYNTGWYDSSSASNQISSINIPTRAGYQFEGYYTSDDVEVIDESGNILVNDLTFNEDITITAKWTIINYNISYNLNDGTVQGENPTTYNVESGNITLINPTKLGYEFIGWTGTELDSATLDVTIPTGSTGVRSYTANFTPTIYTINYNLLNGIVEPDNPDTYTIESDDITLNNPTKTGYDFAGWTGTDLDSATQNVTISSGSTGERNYNATYTPIVYTISYDLNDGTVEGENPTTYTIESDNITLINPTRTGYTFAGWTGTDLDSATLDVTILSGSINPRSYIANWDIINYVITYELNDGVVEGENPTIYNIESDNITLINPTKEGYTFIGWTGEDLTEEALNVIIPAGSTENKTYTANYIPTEYEITYDLDGGEVLGNPNTYTIISDDITLINPTKEGYTFVGWIGTDLDSASLEVVIPSGSINPRSYTATWEEIIEEETPEETEGIGYSDLDDIKEEELPDIEIPSNNPQTDDEIVIYITLLVISGLVLFINRKRLYN